MPTLAPRVPIHCQWGKGLANVNGAHATNTGMGMKSVLAWAWHWLTTLNLGALAGIPSAGGEADSDGGACSAGADSDGGACSGGASGWTANQGCEVCKVVPGENFPT